MRDELVGQGIVINGLPIMLKMATGFFDLADLDRYYTDCVIGGTGAFMIPIKDRIGVPDRHAPQAAAGDRRPRAARRA